MKFIIKVLLATFIFYGSANAEWVIYSGNADKNMLLEYQNLSLSKKDHYLTVLIRKNFKNYKEVVLEGRKISYKSAINKQLIDCHNNRYATTEVMVYEGWGAGGEKLYTTIMDKLVWNDVKKKSVQEGLMEKICIQI